MSKANPEIDDNILWYKDAIIYELHIKAFMDKNGDGKGDFAGLLHRLDYLEDLGVTAIWLLPFYPSPLRDDGYDIADYYSINPSYGNIADFKKFLKAAHKRNMRVITELVLNHTSDQHPWFQRARKAPKGSEERNYYVWSDDPQQFSEVRIIFQDYETSNWAWDPVAQQYYWHRFFHHQPDLNYDSPKVQEEVFKIIDYWLNMGVDGFRLDAVPYLFQREGTNCENLPETHAFLKKLRKHVDDHHSGKMLLAEANMWPEDSASYFGDGDECHMNYHFPIMPRMFMAMRMEDRYPITDIFDQTPAIPNTCQWAIFLRNHDELTLEMVTDEERDYMYKVYARNPKAKINLGIRHRLAPLMENNRRKIELINYLLFSLPGTPVIYYGDEIGMGDNYYLGDRDGVRTPMQWSPDRNAGFSEANPQKLYLPVILDPEYHFEFVNVEIQQANTSSLLWWMKRVINMRKKIKAFSRGDVNFIHTDNSKVLVFTRSHEEETVLVVANLSRFSQAASPDLSEYAGKVPVEVFSKNKFPIIQEDQDYTLTLGPHAYHWFLLKREQVFAERDNSQPSIQLEKWEGLEDKAMRSELENVILPEFLPRCEWFGGASKTLQGIKILGMIPFEEIRVYALLLEAAYESELPEMYQLWITYDEPKIANPIATSFPHSFISHFTLSGQKCMLYDAVFSDRLQGEFLKRAAQKKSKRAGENEINFSGTRVLTNSFKGLGEIKPRMAATEQDNISFVYNNAYFLKIYRKLDYAIHPDIEITRFLSEKVKFPNVPTFAGSIEWKTNGDTIEMAMLQEMVENQGDAWTYLMDALKRYYERLQSSVPQKFLHGVTEENESILPDDMDDEHINTLLGVVVAERVRLLGIRTGEMHIALASDTDLPDFRPEAFSLHYQRSLFSSFQSLVRSTYQSLDKHLDKLPLHLRTEAEKVVPLKQSVLKTLKRIYEKKLNVVKIRTHGDYHLKQVLFTGKDFIIHDFEGKPFKTYSQRRLKRSPLRDVASMIRSFHRVTYEAIILDENIRTEDFETLIPWAERWFHHMSKTFLKAYLKTVKGSIFIPEHKEDFNNVLQIFLLEKAINELKTELEGRPERAMASLKAIQAFVLES